MRERSKLSANADIGRMKRQQVFIASMINKVDLGRDADQALPRLRLRRGRDEVDRPRPGTGLAHKLAGLARQFRETDLDNIEFITVPFMEYEPNPNRLVWAPEADKLWKRIIADKPLDKSSAAR